MTAPIPDGTAQIELPSFPPQPPPQPVIDRLLSIYPPVADHQQPVPVLPDGTFPPGVDVILDPTGRPLPVKAHDRAKHSMLPVAG